MKKSLITIISGLCIVATSATMAAASTTVPKSAARSTVAGASSASSGFPAVCPSGALVGKALGLTLSKPAVTKESGTPFWLLNCKYTATPAIPANPSVEWQKQTPALFSAAEKTAIKTEHAVAVPGLGDAAYRVPYSALNAALSSPLYVLKGGVVCTVDAWFSSMSSAAVVVGGVKVHLESTAQLETLAKQLLKSYW
jgi:hypothetical protein